MQQNACSHDNSGLAARTAPQIPHYGADVDKNGAVQGQKWRVNLLSVAQFIAIIGNNSTRARRVRSKERAGHDAPATGVAMQRTRI